MGSWDATCGLTQLPISPGDEVVLFLLVDNTLPDHLQGDRNANGHCYANAYWTPFSMHLYGTYDDYGRFAIEDGWHKQFVIEQISNYALELPEGENPYHDIEVTKQKLQDWNFIQGAIHEGRLCVNEFDKHRNIGQMAIHRRIFDALVSQKLELGWDMYVEIKDYRDAADIYVNEYREHLVQRAKHRPSADMTRLDFDRMIFTPTRNKFSSFYCHNHGEGYWSGMPAAHTIYYEKLVSLIDAGGAHEQISALLDTMSEFLFFTVAMTFLRKTWMPQAGAGGQSEGYDLYSIVFKAGQEIIKEAKKKYED